MLAGVKRVDAVKKLLDGEDFENLDIIDIDTPLSYGYINDSFYICVDMEGKIITDCIKGNKEIEETYKKCLTDIKDKVLNMGKENTHGSK